MIIKIEDAPGIKHINIDINFEDNTPMVNISKDFKSNVTNRDTSIAPTPNNIEKTPWEGEERPKNDSGMVNEEF